MADEVTRKAFMGRVRARNPWKRAFAPYAKAPPFRSC